MTSIQTNDQKQHVDLFRKLRLRKALCSNLTRHRMLESDPGPFAEWKGAGGIRREAADG